LVGGIKVEVEFGSEVGVVFEDELDQLNILPGILSCQLTNKETTKLMRNLVDHFPSQLQWLWQSVGYVLSVSASNVSLTGIKQHE